MEKIKHRLFTKKEKYIVLSKTNGVCAHCGKKLNIDTMTVEHVFPINKGGLDDEYNLIALCPKCNNDKSNFVYSLREYCKHIAEEERGMLQQYNDYVTFDYRKKSILGYDIKLFHFIPYQYSKMIYDMQRRKTNSKKISESIKNLRVSLLLSRAYPADADEIFRLIQKEREVTKHSLNDLYQSPYEILNDIKTGCVYTLQKNGKICGAFIYKSLDEIDGGIHIPQLNNIADETGMKVKYIMTYACVNAFSHQVFDNVMQYLENCHTKNGWIPVYFGILSKMYREKEECIIMPYTLNNVTSTIEFMPIKHLCERESEYIEDLFCAYGYDDVPDEDIKYFKSLDLKYTNQSELDEDEEAKEFLKKYPDIRDYFRTDSYCLYNVGFLNDWDEENQKVIHKVEIENGKIIVND